MSSLDKEDSPRIGINELFEGHPEIRGQYYNTKRQASKEVLCAFPHKTSVSIISGTGLQRILHNEVVRIPNIGSDTIIIMNGNSHFHGFTVAELPTGSGFQPDQLPVALHSLDGNSTLTMFCGSCDDIAVTNQLRELVGQLGRNVQNIRIFPNSTPEIACALVATPDMDGKPHIHLSYYPLEKVDILI
jgi:hypothetical protein